MISESMISAKFRQISNWHAVALVVAAFLSEDRIGLILQSQMRKSDGG